MDYIDLGFWGRRAYGIYYIGKALKSCRRRGSAKQKDYPRNPLVSQSIGYCVQITCSCICPGRLSSTY